MIIKFTYGNLEVESFLELRTVSRLDLRLLPRLLCRQQKQPDLGVVCPSAVPAGDVPCRVDRDGHATRHGLVVEGNVQVATL